MRTLGWAWLIGLVLVGLVGCGSEEQDQSPESKALELFNQAKVAIAEDNQSEAMSLLDEAIELDPQAMYYLEKGDLLYLQRRFDGALIAYEQAQARDDDLPEAYLAAALAHQQLREFTLAMADLDEAAELFWQVVDEYENREADPALDDRHDRDRMIEARAHLAHISMLRGDREAAVEAINLLRDEYPDHSVVHHFHWAIVEMGIDVTQVPE